MTVMITEWITLSLFKFRRHREVSTTNTNKDEPLCRRVALFSPGNGNSDTPTTWRL